MNPRRSNELAVLGSSFGASFVASGIDGDGVTSGAGVACGAGAISGAGKGVTSGAGAASGVGLDRITDSDSDSG